MFSLFKMCNIVHSSINCSNEDNMNIPKISHNMNKFTKKSVKVGHNDIKQDRTDINQVGSIPYTCHLKVM
jgi:hypothetical protein